MTTVTLRVKDRKRKRSYLYLDYYPPYMDPVTRVTKRQEYLGVKGKVDFPQIGFEKRTTERGFSKVSKSV